MREGTFCSSLYLQCIEQCLLHTMHTINICWMNELASKNHISYSATPKSLSPRNSPLLVLIQNSTLSTTPYPSSLFTLILRLHGGEFVFPWPSTFALSSLPFLDSLDSVVSVALMSISSITHYCHCKDLMKNITLEESNCCAFMPALRLLRSTGENKNHNLVDYINMNSWSPSSPHTAWHSKYASLILVYFPGYHDNYFKSSAQASQISSPILAPSQSMLEEDDLSSYIIEK